MKNLISIIVPVFNGQNYLHRCLESLINQSYQNIEIILVDDGSTDNSGKICDQYAISDKRIRAIHQKNRGPGAARNNGIKHSKGEFLFFVDVDDFIEKDALFSLIGKNNQHELDLIVGDFRIKTNELITPETKYLFSNSKALKKQEIVNYVKDYLRKPTGYSLFIYAWGKLFKSSILKRNNIYFDEELPIFEDILFNYKYLQFVRSVYYVRKHIYTFITFNNPESSSSKIYDYYSDYRLVLKSIEKFLFTNGTKNSMVHKLVGNAHIHFAIRIMVRFFVKGRKRGINYFYRLIYAIVNNPEIRQNLKYYSPSKGDSKILPLLIRWKLVWAILFICKYKAYQRYIKGNR